VIVVEENDAIATLPTFTSRHCRSMSHETAMDEEIATAYFLKMPSPLLNLKWSKSQRESKVGLNSISLSDAQDILKLQRKH